jgi:hypothetical protein
MHKKRVERLKRKEKRNKMLNSWVFPELRQLHTFGAATELSARDAGNTNLPGFLLALPRFLGSRLPAGVMRLRQRKSILKPGPDFDVGKGREMHMLDRYGNIREGVLLQAT